MSTTSQVEAIIRTGDKELYRIGEKILAQERITAEEGLELFERGSLPYLGSLANYVRERKHGDKTYFNR
ncbi:MAG TPA: aminofutalosine synthase MqnE, partial [Puia sp.]|nr:aminofutalosine synthase MqnE [Puia sp.]